MGVAAGVRWSMLELQMQLQLRVPLEDPDHLHFLQQNLTDTQRLHSAQSQRAASALHTLAVFHQQVGNLKLASEASIAELRMNKRLHGVDSVELFALHRWHASLYAQSKQHALAMTQFKRAVTIMELHSDSVNAVEVAVLHAEMAACHAAELQWQEAKRCNLAALPEFEAALPISHELGTLGMNQATTP